MIKRNTGIGLLKVIAIIFICASSALPYGVMYQGGYSDAYVNLNNANSLTNLLGLNNGSPEIVGGILLTLFRYLGQVGDTLFIMCSAWFLCDRDSAKADKCIKLILDSFVISIIGLGIASVFLSPSLKEIIRCIFPITLQTNWFVGCYIIYYLIHPLLNKAVKGLSRPQFRFLVVLMFLAYSVISTVHGSYYFTNLVAFIMMHYLVAFAKKYEMFKHDTKQDVMTILACSGLLLMSIVLMIILGSRIGLLADKNLLLCHFYNPLIIGIVTPVLFTAVRRKRTSGIVNSISSLSLFVYLIHGNYFWQAYGKYAAHHYFQMNGFSIVGSTLVLFAITVIASVIIAFLYKSTADKATGALAKKIGNGVIRAMGI